MREGGRKERGQARLGPLTDVGVPGAYPEHVDLADGVALGLLDGGVVGRLLPADVDDLHGVLLLRRLLHHAPHRAADAPGNTRHDNTTRVTAGALFTLFPGPPYFPY